MEKTERVGNGYKADKNSKKKLKWILIIIISIILILVISGLIIVLSILSNNKDEGNDLGISNTRFYGLDVAPNAPDTLFYDIPDANDANGHKNLALQLYTIASTNDLNVEKRLLLNKCPTLNNVLNMSNYIDLDIVEIKNGDRYFRIDYRIKNSIPLFDNPVLGSAESALNNMLELVLTERKYYEPSLGAMKYQKVKNAYVSGAGLPFAIWSKNVTEADLSAPVFNAAQGLPYEKCEHAINAETLLGANVTFNEDGYYEVVLTMDLENEATTAKKIDDVKKGTGDENAKFIQLDIKFQVWKSGFFKSFDYTEVWEAVASGFKVRGEFYNREIFSYDERDCDLENNKDCYAFMVALGLREERIIEEED